MNETFAISCCIIKDFLIETYVMEIIRKLNLFKTIFGFNVIFFVAVLSYLFLTFVYIVFINKVEYIPKKYSKGELLISERQVNIDNFNYFFVNKQDNQSEKQSQIFNPVSFKLLGTIITDATRSAIIKMDDKIKVVKKYDKIAENVVLVGVNEFYILVDVFGKKQVVQLNNDFKQSIPNEKIPPLSDVVPIPKGAQNFTVDKRLVEEMTRDMGQFLKDIRIVPYFENGVTQGFKFEFVRPGSFFEQNGISQGDKLISINGNPVLTAEDSFKLYNLLRTEKYISIVVEGQNGRRTLNYEIR